MQKAFKIIGTTFFSIGLVLLVVSFLIYRGTASFITDSIRTSGTVIDLTMERSTHTDNEGTSSTSSVYYPVVQFTTEDGETIQFRGSAGSNPPDFRKGQTVPLRYQPENPYNAKVDTFVSMWLAVLIIGSIGITFFILGTIFLIIPVHKSRQDAWLQEHGRIITAEIDRVDFNRGIRVNGQNPYVIYAQWHDSGTGRIYIFRSKDIWYNPEKYLHARSVHVRIHPDNPRKYVMDTSFLPQDDSP